MRRANNERLALYVFPLPVALPELLGQRASELDREVVTDGCVHFFFGLEGRRRNNLAFLVAGRVNGGGFRTEFPSWSGTGKVRYCAGLINNETGLSEQGE